MNSPSLEYTQRIERRREALRQKLGYSRKLWLLRRTLMAMIAVMIVLAIDRHLAAWWIALPVTAFIALMAIHQRVLGEVERLERAVNAASTKDSSEIHSVFIACWGKTRAGEEGNALPGYNGTVFESVSGPKGRQRSAG